MYSQQRASQISGGVFLIGLGLLFTNVLPWWPGIMFVIGASAIAKGLAQGGNRGAIQGGIWVIVIGLVFGMGRMMMMAWPLILIAIGASMLFGRSWLRPGTRYRRRERRMFDDFGYEQQTEKRKNDMIMRNEQPDREFETNGDLYRLGDDGELIKVKNDETYAAGNRK